MPRNETLESLIKEVSGLPERHLLTLLDQALQMKVLSQADIDKVWEDAVNPWHVSVEQKARDLEIQKSLGRIVGESVYRNYGDIDTIVLRKLDRPTSDFTSILQEADRIGKP